MRSVRTFAMRLGVGLAVVYLFFLIPSIEMLFDSKFILTLRQTLVLAFAACLLFNYEGIINSGQKLVPKIMDIMSILFSIKNKNNDS